MWIFTYLQDFNESELTISLASTLVPTIRTLMELLSWITISCYEDRQRDRLSPTHTRMLCILMQ